ncbi:phosphopantetheine-binding protein [Streptomyces sp. 5K101]|uniref:phosphopantetheine-binding protein n=1 Tax=Streptomyces sp. 5K101 TaxID=3390037 RepID=UPI003975FFA9
MTTAPEALTGGATPRQPRDDLCDVPYRAPSGELATTVAALTADVLGVDRVGLDDSFYDFGGTSLQAMRLCVRLQKETGHAPTPVDILEHDVLADLVELLTAHGDGGRD